MLATVVVYFVLTVGAIFMLLPFVWMIITSLKEANEVMSMPPVWIPSSWEWSNYAEAWAKAPFDTYFMNSMIITVVVTVGELITTILAAYAFSRMSFYGRDVLFVLFLATMMVPGEVLLIPNYVTVTEFGWLNSYEALIVPWTASVFAIFLLRQWFLNMPKELSYAAKIDGCKDRHILLYVFVPLAKPSLVTIALLKIVGSWNAFLWPLIVTNSVEMRTLPVGLTSFTTEAGTIYELLMAASTMVILPMVLLFFFTQKYIVAGVARAGIKG